MILADKIINERKKLGWSQEDLAENLSVSRQAVSKWESAQSVPDLQRIIQLSDLFGVATDYLLKDEIEDNSVITRSENLKDVGNDTPRLPRVSMEEAHTFLELKKELAPKVANGVSICILSPCVLIALTGLADAHIIKSEGFAISVGMFVLLGLVALAVFMFITIDAKCKPYKYLEEDDFETAYGITGMTLEKKNAFSSKFGMGIGLGVVLCILAALPLIIAGAMGASDLLCIIFTALLLVFVAVGVNSIVRVNIIQDSYDTLLQEGEYTPTVKRFNKKTASVKLIYWCTVTAIYLGWSFISDSWEFTWIVWPVAGVMYGAFAAFLEWRASGKA